MNQQPSLKPRRTQHKKTMANSLRAVSMATALQSTHVATSSQGISKMASAMALAK